MILPPPSRNSYNKGFTLAEVLIALVIIGVISAITISSLIQNTQKQEFVSSLKKTYSVLSQVTNQIIAEEGSPLGDEGWAATNDSILEQYKKHLNNIKECEAGRDCFKRNVKFLAHNGTDSIWGNKTDMTSFIMADGVQVLVGRGGSNPFLIIDINGEKGPNTYGRDVFWFYITNSGFIPRVDASDTCPGTSNGNWGKGCASKVLSEGAMNY